MSSSTDPAVARRVPPEMSESKSSTIIAPPSAPTYQALSRARAGVANAVEASATARASFRIVFPFQNCHKGLEKLPNPKKVSVQGHNSRSCCQNAAVFLCFQKYIACVSIAPLNEAVISERI